MATVIILNYILHDILWSLAFGWMPFSDMHAMLMLWIDSQAHAIIERIVVVWYTSPHLLETTMAASTTSSFPNPDPIMAAGIILNLISQDILFLIGHYPLVG